MLTEPVCLCHDDFVEELQDKGNVIWVATLSDGTTAYQDDGRPGLTEPAWLRLAAHLKANGLSILALRLKFRTEWLDFLPRDRWAYYWSRGAAATWGGPTRAFVAVGYCDGPGCKLRVTRVLVPELTIETVDDRELPDADPRVIVRA